MSNPVTDTTRRIKALLEFARDACIGAGVPAEESEDLEIHIQGTHLVGTPATDLGERDRSQKGNKCSPPGGARSGKHLLMACVTIRRKQASQT